MGILNRSKDTSEQQQVLSVAQDLAVTGIDYPVAQAPHAMTIQKAKLYARAISGTPTVTLNIKRFVVGAGATTISISSALTVAAYATSGALSFTLPAAGSTLLNLQANDILVATTGGSNAASNELLVSVVVQNTQDILSWY